MSMGELERATLAAARVAFNNPKLRRKDLMEWSTAEPTAEPSEVVLWVSKPGVYVAIKAEHDKRLRGEQEGK